MRSQIQASESTQFVEKVVFPPLGILLPRQPIDCGQPIEFKFSKFFYMHKIFKKTGL